MASHNRQFHTALSAACLTKLSLGDCNFCGKAFPEESLHEEADKYYNLVYICSDCIARSVKCHEGGGHRVLEHCSECDNLVWVEFGIASNEWGEVLCAWCEDRRWHEEYCCNDCYYGHWDEWDDCDWRWGWEDWLCEADTKTDWTGFWDLAANPNFEIVDCRNSRTGAYVRALVN